MQITEAFFDRIARLEKQVNDQDVRLRSLEHQVTVLEKDLADAKHEPAFSG